MSSIPIVMRIMPGAITIFRAAMSSLIPFCHERLEKPGIPSLDEVRKQNIRFRNSKIVLPDITFNDGSLTLRVGKKTLGLFPLPGHAPDNVAVLVEEDRVLFAGDACMPLPYIAMAILTTWCPR